MQLSLHINFFLVSIPKTGKYMKNHFNDSILSSYLFANSEISTNYIYKDYTNSKLKLKQKLWLQILHNFENSQIIINFEDSLTKKRE